MILVNFRKTIVFFSILIMAFSFISPVLAESNSTIHFFWSSGCPHCSEAKSFLNDLKNDFPEIKIKDYEFSKNIDLIKELYLIYNVSSGEQGYVPVIFTPDNYFIGFNKQIGQEIERCVRECIAGEEKQETRQTVKLPIFGEVFIEDFSLPVLAIVLGTLDGFNICSLGALVLILTLILALKSRRKIIIFGSIFILTTVVVYILLVLLWHQLFVFLAPQINRMELFIGVLALVGAIYFINEFYKSFKNKNICSFGGFTQKLLQRIQKVFESKASILVLIISILLFAAIVTVIEFPCTAFFPVLFTGILAKADISFSLSLFYIAIYGLFYMLDELIIFLIAIFTMKIWIASSRSLMIINAIGALLLLALGLYYLLGIF
ncbi:hypothetical protein FJ208_01300 [Candidatus Gribaldobacteria bacterium]|nr:hypothetical protein [Candidatus Gribaldobacteria bacterium]